MGHFPQKPGLCRAFNKSPKPGPGLQKCSKLPPLLQTTGIILRPFPASACSARRKDSLRRCFERFVRNCGRYPEKLCFFCKIGLLNMPYPAPHRGSGPTFAPPGAGASMPPLTPKIMGLAQICKMHLKARVNSVGSTPHV